MKLRSDFIDITGQRFGELIAIKPVKKGIYRGVKWLCKCDCGNETIAQGGHLRAGKRLSCGCRSKSRLYETCINNIYSSYKSGAKRRNHVFELSRDAFKDFILKDCFYCGSKPYRFWKAQRPKTNGIYYNGIDRIDHKKGYIVGNIATCCYYCNHAKADQSYEAFVKHIERIYKWQQKGL